MPVKKSGLGKGLDSLIPNKNVKSAKPSVKADEKKAAPKEEILEAGPIMVKINKVEPNREQPRKDFDEDALMELADSIKQFGVLQPILVQKKKDYYEIIAGERRWRAAKLAGLKEVPIIVKEFTEQEIVEISLIENIQRENLNPIEEAQGYFELMESFGMTQDEISKTVGRSRSAVANAIRLLNLPEKIRDMLEDGDLTVGHAKALMAFDDEGLMTEAAEKACGGRLTVRELEKMAQNRDKSDKNKTNERIDSYFKEMEIGLHEALGRKVKVEYGKNKGALILEFYDRDDLSELAKRLTKE